MATPSYVAAGTLQSGSLASSVAVNKPASATTGRAWVVWVNTTNARTFAAPAGWTRIGTDATTAAMFVRICDGTETATVTFTWTGGTSNYRANSIVYSNVHTTSPITVGGAWTVTAAGVTTIAITGVTVPAPATAGNDLLVSFAGLAGAVTVITKPASMTQDYQLNTTQTNAAARETAVAGATGTRSWTWAGGQQGLGINFVLQGTPVPMTENLGVLPI